LQSIKYECIYIMSYYEDTLYIFSHFQNIARGFW